jgi:hypothetical protein
MIFRQLRTPVTLTLIAFGLLGCSGLNPGLAGLFGDNSVSSISTPKGAIIVLVENQSATSVLTNLRAQKANGGIVELNIVTGAVGDPSYQDHVAAVQDCDIASLYFDEYVYVGDTAPVLVPFARPPLQAGDTLSCGKVVLIRYDGQAPNLLVTVSVF